MRPGDLGPGHHAGEHFAKPRAGCLGGRERPEEGRDLRSAGAGGGRLRLHRGAGVGAEGHQDAGS